jgi:hypothetical protein
MHNVVAEYLSKFKDHVDELYAWPFDESIPRTQFGFRFSGNTPFQKTLELKQQVSDAAINATSDDEKEKLATYFIKVWGGISKILDIREIVSRFNPVAFSETSSNADFSFKRISSWSKWLSVVCPKWACIYDTRVAYSLNVINYISGAKHKIFPMPDGRNTQINILDVTTLLLSKKLSTADSSKPKTIRESHFIGESIAYKSYIDVIHKVSSLLWGGSEPPQLTEMLLFSLADSHIYENLFEVVSRAHD